MQERRAADQNVHMMRRSWSGVCNHQLVTSAFRPALQTNREVGAALLFRNAPPQTAIAIGIPAAENERERSDKERTAFSPSESADAGHGDSSGASKSDALGPPAPAAFGAFLNVCDVCLNGGQSMPLPLSSSSTVSSCSRGCLPQGES